MNSLSNNERYYISNSLDGIDIITENITSNALLVDGSNFMMADLDAGGHNVKNMANAVALTDAVPLGQLNTTLGNYVDLTTNQTIGGTKTFSNQVNFNGATKTNLVATDIPNAGNRIWMLNDAGTSQTIAGSKNWSNSTSFNGPNLNTTGTNVNINSTNLNVSATTITNLNNGANCNNKNLTNVLDPVNAQDASTKNYTDTKVSKSGDTMTGILNISIPGTSTNTNKTLNITTNNNGIWFNPYLTSTAYNNLVASGDKGIIFSNGTQNTGDLVIGSWSNGTNGIKILGSSGNIGIGIIPTTKLDVNGNSLIRGSLNMNTTNKIINVADPTNAQDVSTKNYVDTQTTNTNYLLRNGTLAMTGSLDMNTTNKIINVADPTNAQDVATKNYTDSANNLKVSKSGDTMTGDLSINAVLNLNAGTPNDPNVDPANKTNTYIRFGEAGATSDFAYLRQIGGSNDIQLALDLHDNGTDGQFHIRSVGSINNPDTIKPFFTSGLTGTIINKNATSPNILTTSGTSFNLISGQTIYDVYNFTSGTNVNLYLINKASSDTSLINKVLYFNFTSPTKVFINAYSGGTINWNGVDYTTPFLLSVSQSFKLNCSTTIGFYTFDIYQDITGMNTDQLTLQSNLGTIANSEFTGIKFSNTNTDAGLIRVESDRDHNNSVMRFYNRIANNLNLQVELGSTINAFKPIIRNAWSSGELIKTTIFSRATTGVSKVANVNAGATLDWLFPTMTMSNTPTNSIIVVNFDAPYHFTGSAQDTIELYIYDTTGGTPNLVFAKSQYYENAGGGGTRSGTLFPFSFSHTPSQATSTYTRTYQVSILNRSSSDVVRLCQGVFNNTIINLDYYTFEMKEIKI